MKAIMENEVGDRRKSRYQRLEREKKRKMKNTSKIEKEGRR